ncbi:hypothetical protein B0H10DRAFT_2212280 [Mycena sp. CBHHK59/15]|nr:hypothetical protein B0H10DRAFT_2212280 [Mycena sp. CBHHK59/15]
MPFFHSRNADEPSRHDHHAAKEPQRMEILLDHDYVFLRGTGADVEPARLSGNVVLYLTEPTAIKSITLQLRGKAYLPVPPTDPNSSSNPPSTYILCKHNWSFLEGEKKHGYTLKAGRHLFPFQLQVGGSLPCSMITSAFGGASVTYKLRAVAHRTGAFTHNKEAVAPVYILRSLGRAALEYQQTRDIEHSWAGKLMFSVAIPHTAWAAGDDLVSLLKICPLVKGVGVLTVTTSIGETTKVYGRSGGLTRTVASVMHEIVGGKAVEVKYPADHKGKRASLLPLRSPTTPSSSEASPSGSRNTVDDAPPPSDPTQSEDDVVTALHLRIPSHLTPTHQLEPIYVTHVVHWSVIVTNGDGHLSELFCSLPILLLDPQLLSESRAHTRMARQLLVGGGSEILPETDDANELPSYVQHVRDRVANMFFSEGNTMRVTNPWIQSGVNPILVDGQRPTASGSPDKVTPLELITDSNDPYIPDPEHPVFLDWINAELLISQGATKMAHPNSFCGADEGSAQHGDSTSGSSSTQPSRRMSRSSSPDCGCSTPPAATSTTADGVPTYTHASKASRALPSLFVALMEPTSVLTHPHWLAARPDPKDPRASSIDIQRRVREVSRPDPEVGSVLLHRAFTEVPDYEVALRGFLGGVPPLSSMQGLPSYDEAEASRSGTPDVGVESAPAGQSAAASGL